MSQSLSTFKQQCDFWADRPQLILCEETQVSKVNWCSSVHHLSMYQQILHATVDPEEEDTIVLSFCIDKPPHTKLQRLQIPQGNSNSLVIPIDRRCSEDKLECFGQFYIILATE